MTDIESAPAVPRVAAVMTVFNRKDETLTCLSSVQQQGQDRADVTTFVVDDASTDGTAEAIAQEFPKARLLHGSGDLYWNGGMRKGFGAALAEGFDHYWWLNDDVELDDDALTALLDTLHEVSKTRPNPPIVVGATREPDGGHTTYGGVRRENPGRPLDFSLVEPGDRPVRVQTMNGNCVVIPKEVAHNVGNIEPSYRQKMGDFDYGLRATQLGFEVWLAPSTHGVCATHPPRRTDTQPLSQEIQRLWSVKELPPAAWLMFTRRWAGPLWPLYFGSPYVRRALRLVGERLGR